MITRRDGVTVVAVAAVCLGLAVMGVVLLIGCDSNPAEPEPDPPEEELTDYRVWFWNSTGSNKLYAYHTATGDVDTTDIPWEPTQGLAVSHDGKLLYLAQQNSVVVVDTDSLTLVAELPYASRGVVVSPDGRHIAILSNDTTWVLRTSDYILVRTDTPRSGHACFSGDGKHLYGTDAEANVWRMSLSDLTEPVTRKPIASGLPGVIIPTPDESKWLMYVKLPAMYTHAFEVYDVALDSTVFREILRPGVGYVAMTPDGKWAFYGNPGSEMIGPPATSDFRVFDIVNNRIDQIVSTEHFIDENTPNGFPVGKLVVTPDGRRLVASSEFTGINLLVYDLSEDRFVDYMEFGYVNT